jgi:hypothetical protein
LAAFVIVFVVFYAPYMPAALRASEARQTLLDEQDLSDLCVKWGLILQTREHTACTMDMRQFRSGIEQQLIARFQGVF